jgi:hypothetical protein
VLGNHRLRGSPQRYLVSERCCAHIQKQCFLVDLPRLWLRRLRTQRRSGPKEVSRTRVPPLSPVMSQEPSSVHFMSILLSPQCLHYDRTRSEASLRWFAMGRYHYELPLGPEHNQFRDRLSYNRLSGVSAGLYFAASSSWEPQLRLGGPRVGRVQVVRYAFDCNPLETITAGNWWRI